MGTLLVVEPIMPDAPSSSPDVLMMVMSDLNMLVGTGGKERTEVEFHAMLGEAGFTVSAVKLLADGCWASEAVAR